MTSENGTLPAIRIEHLSKDYRLGVFGHRTLRDELLAKWHRLRGRNPEAFLGKVGDVPRSNHGVFHALRDVSFDVMPGETVGFVGRNGAGKSTCLKLLSRISLPTEGRIELRGRVGALLEVGTGFHPELTGRDNIYLNGAILGMKRREIDHVFRQIVDFSEIGPHLNTPVKRYSSGMYVRLAFSVAAHLQTDILLIDEVLAVGDAEFRKRSLERMLDIAKSGRTILFVSHQAENIRRLCRKCVWFDDGRVREIGTCESVLGSYQAVTEREKTVRTGRQKDCEGQGAVCLTDCALAYDADACHWDVRLAWKRPQGGPWKAPRVVVCLHRPGAIRPLTTLDSRTMDVSLPRELPPEGSLVCSLSSDVWLPPETWRIDVALYDSSGLCQRVENAAQALPTALEARGGWRLYPEEACDIHIRHCWRLE